MRACICFLAAAAVVMLIAAPALPQQILVVNRDADKSFNDPEGGGYVDIAYGIREALTANGYAHTYQTTFPADISPYDIIFVCLGWC